MCCVNLFCLVFICLLKANHRKNAVINIEVLFVDPKRKKMILKDDPVSAIC